MTDFIANDRDAIRARMEEIAKERAEVLSQPATDWCSCSHTGTQYGANGAIVCSGCMRPKEKS